MLKHERAVEAAIAAEEQYERDVILYSRERRIRKIIAAFLAAVEPSEEMLQAPFNAPLRDDVKPLVEKNWRAMSKALAEELKSP